MSAPWFAALVRKLAAPPKRGGIRLTQDEANRLLRLLQAADDLADYYSDRSKHITVVRLSEALAHDGEAT